MGDRRTDTEPTADVPGFARRLLTEVRRQEPVAALRQTLANLDAEALEPLRTERRTALAFWLNLYNATTQLLLERQPELFDARWRFFRTTGITVSGVELSLDDIEHGILRGGRSKYGFGYLPRLARTGLGRDYRLDVDERIHFALNCGALSCPRIRTYDPDTIDETLDRATKVHLEQTAIYDQDRDRVHLPRFCLWFIGDFGGPSGLRAFLRQYGQIPPDTRPSLRFNGYDWRKAPREFVDE